MSRAVTRLMDANINRSREGIRVCEEIARFILQSAPLTSEFKDIRHRIWDIAQSASLGAKKLNASRDTAADIGRSSELLAAKTRRDCLDIFTANMERAKEALRVLEEMSKLNDIKVSRRFKDLRFRVYEIERRTSKKLESLRGIK